MNDSINGTVPQEFRLNHPRVMTLCEEGEADVACGLMPTTTPGEMMDFVQAVCICVATRSANGKWAWVRPHIDTRNDIERFLIKREVGKWYYFQRKSQ
jgi:hypothetical protein